MPALPGSSRRSGIRDVFLLVQVSGVDVSLAQVCYPKYGIDFNENYPIYGIGFKKPNLAGDVSLTGADPNLESDCRL